MKHARTLLVGLMATSVYAQDSKPQPVYIGATYVMNQGDLLKYAGGKKMSYAWEAGWEFLSPAEVIGATTYVRYMRTFGDRRYGAAFPPGGVCLNLDTWTWGIDLTFATPVKGLIPYAGFNLNYFDGSKSDAFGNPKYSFGDPGPKPGIRMGVQYKINQRWSALVDYNFAEWREAKAEPRIQGVNPMNPSWVGFTVRYNFEY